MAKQTVLLVDADTRSARVLEVSLRKAGYSVTLVKSAVEAIEAIEIAPPDLVLSDTRLAEPTAGGAAGIVDGYQLCRRMKDDPVWFSTPFMFLTSSSSIEDKVRGLQLGVEDYLTKPIYIKELLTRIELVLARKRREGMEARSSRASFTGLLSEMGLVDLLSTIDLGRKSGTAEFRSAQGSGTLMFRDGRVVDARTGRYGGAAAVYRMLHWADGEFELRFGPCTVDDVVELPTQGLLMEGMRRLDEWQRMTEQLPPLDAIYDVDMRELAARLGEIPDEVNQILRAFDGKRSLLAVVDASGFDDLSALSTLSKLYFEGLIVPRASASSDDALEHDEQNMVVPGADLDALGEQLARGDSAAPAAPVDAPRGPAHEPPTESSDAPASTPARTTLPRVDDVVPAQEAQRAAEHEAPEPSSEATRSAMPPPAALSAAAVARVEPPFPDPIGPRAVASANERERRAPSPAVAADEHEEREVSKHRGKRNRSKREVAAEGSAQGAARTSAPPPAAATSGAAPAVEARSEAASASTSGPAPAATPAPAPEPRTGATVIQFPKNPLAVAASEKSEDKPAAEKAPEKPEEKPSEKPAASEPAASAKPAPVPEPSFVVSPELLADAPAEAPAASSGVAVPPVSGRTLIGDAFADPKLQAAVQAARASAAEVKVEAAKSEAPKSEAAKSEAPKSEPAKTSVRPEAPKASVPPPSAASVKPAKTTEGAAKKPEPEAKPAPENKKRDPGKDAKPAKEPEGKGEGAKRVRTSSFSGELGDDAKAFFSDQSYQSAYKGGHDSFDDLKPEDSSDQARNKRLMYVTGGFIALIVLLVGGLAVHQRVYGVDERALPSADAVPSTAARVDTPSAEPTAARSDEPSAAPSAVASASSEPSAAPSAAPSSEPSSEPSAAPSAASSAVASASPSAEPTVAPTAVPSAAPSAVAASAAPSAAGGGGSLEELLANAQRARSRGAAAAVTAYQAWVDAGGNDGAVLAQFAFWLANRGDLARANDWAQRATTADPNNQLGWYMLGATRMEGPRADRNAAREALRRCVALPGRYAAECRGML